MAAAHRPRCCSACPGSGCWRSVRSTPSCTRSWRPTRRWTAAARTGSSPGHTGAGSTWFVTPRSDTARRPDGGANGSTVAPNRRVGHDVLRGAPAGRSADRADEAGDHLSGGRLQADDTTVSALARRLGVGWRTVWLAVRAEAAARPRCARSAACCGRAWRTSPPARWNGSTPPWPPANRPGRSPSPGTPTNGCGRWQI